MIAEKSMAPAMPLARERRKPLRYMFGRAFIYAIVAAGGAMFMFPFMWAVISSGKTSADDGSLVTASGAAAGLVKPSPLSHSSCSFSSS